MRHPEIIQQLKQNDRTVELAELRGRAGLYAAKRIHPGETWIQAAERLSLDRETPPHFREALKEIVR